MDNHYTNAKKMLGAAILQSDPEAQFFTRQTENHLSAVSKLREAVLEEDWPRVQDLSFHCLGLGLGSYHLIMGNRALSAKRYQGRQALGESLTAAFHTLVQSDTRPELIRSLREKWTGNSDRLEEVIDELEHGHIPSDLPFLRRYTQPGSQFEVRGSRLFDGSTIVVLNRGLLGSLHAEFNQAIRAGTAWSEVALRNILDDGFRAIVEDFRAGLAAHQMHLYNTIVSARPHQELVQAALLLASFVEERLPFFARAQAYTTLGVWSLRQQGKGTAAEKLGGLTVDAGALTREAITSHAASYRLALSSLDHEPPAEVREALNKARSMAFDTSLPNGRNTQLSKLSQVEDDYVVELTRLRGHLYAYLRGVHDAANETTISRRIP